MGLGFLVSWVWWCGGEGEERRCGGVRAHFTCVCVIYERERQRKKIDADVILSMS